MPALTLALGALAMAAAFDASASPVTSDPRLRADLAALAHRSVFFGHQSVGMNVLDGLRELSQGAGVPLRIEEVRSVGALPPGTVAHAFVQENGDPLRKLASFDAALAGPGAPDVALVKFCYVDFNDPRVDVDALFDRYQATLAALEARHPHTVFVRATVPLTVVQRGPKALVKRLLGRAPWGLAENARRDRFNALVRRAAAGKPLFDVAAVESTRPDGSREAFELKGAQVPALVPAYTQDGSHLAGAGRLRAARELVRVIAAAPRG